MPQAKPGVDRPLVRVAISRREARHRHMVKPTPFSACGK